MAPNDSIKNGIKIIGEVLDEIGKYTVQDETIGIRVFGRSRRKAVDLDDSFWESIKQDISDMLVRNYNGIRISNSPKYQQWKERAREESLNVVVTNEGTKKPIVYIRPALRTGTLRERMKDVRIVSKNRIKSSGINKVVYEVDISDLFKNYGSIFSDLVQRKTGKDILALREDQIQIILSKILSKIAEQG